tara:strand:+ start:147 stop:560 length:414 start_codon:yes stop_codon:yes gene_type:complete
MANCQGFTAEKLVPKGGKGVKGAKVNNADDDFTTTSKPKDDKKPAAKKAPAKKKATAEPNVENEDETEEILEFGLASTPKEKAPMAPKKKKPKTTKQIDSSEIPEGKITLPVGDGASSAGDALMVEMETEEADEESD